MEIGAPPGMSGPETGEENTSFRASDPTSPALAWTQSVDTLESLRRRHPGVVINVSERQDGITLSLIRVPRELQRQGKAEAALSDLLRYADRHAKPVALTPERVGNGASEAALKRWYRKHGFVPNSGRNKNWAFRESMIREPRPLERPIDQRPARNSRSNRTNVAGNHLDTGMTVNLYHHDPTAVDGGQRDAPVREATECEARYLDERVDRSAFHADDQAPRSGEGFDAWRARLWRGLRDTGAPIRPTGRLYRAVSDRELETARRRGEFRPLLGNDLYVTDDPDRLAGGAYSAQGNGHIIEIAQNEIDLHPARSQHVRGLRETATDRIPVHAVVRIYSWDAAKRDHTPRAPTDGRRQPEEALEPTAHLDFEGEPQMNKIEPGSQAARDTDVVRLDPEPNRRVEPPDTGYEL
jgi:hypothetical protein